MAQITLRDYLQETEDAISAGRAEEALSRCRHMLTYFPEALEPQRLLGEVHLAQEKLEEARQALDWVLTSDPEHVVAYCDRALISERMADYDTALDCYQQAYELSRGNSQIRSEFNKISAKAGQQGFMFSRAGLARLYMRGDLLSQAVQEWDAVLTTTPDRLDARTGLLETYWREGLYDRVEKLATQILEDIPTCLKALLLLAHVISSKNVQRSQELLKQARTLDPDLMMAQVLFADMFAVQPADPFLRLLKQPPAQLDLSEKEYHTPSAFANDFMRREPDPVLDPDLLRREPDPVPDRDLSTWGVVGTWDNESDLTSPQLAPNATSQVDSELPVWSPSSILGPDPVSQSSPELTRSEPWQAPDKPLEQPSFSDNSLFGSWSQTPEPDELPLAQGPSLQGQSLTDKDAWEASNGYSRSDLSGVDLWKSDGGSGDMESLSSTWSFSPSASDSPTPPNWLNMLTQQDREQMSGAMPSISPSEIQDLAQMANSIKPSPEPSAPAQPANTVAPAQPAKPTVPAQPTNTAALTQPAKPAQPSPEVMPLHNEGASPLDEEESLFGPAWLKSIGAFSMAPEAFQEPAFLPPAVEATSAPSIQEVPVSQEPPIQPANSATVIDAAAQKEQNLLSTLEEFEQDLRSQGFVSLEPNTLATIARNEASNSSNNALEAEPETNSSARSYQDADLSSALAELGNLRSQMEASPDALDEAEVAPAPAQTQEPEWMAALRSFQTPQETSLPEWTESPSAATSNASQKPQQSDEPYWMTPMQAEESQKVEEPDWMATLQSQPLPATQESQKPLAPDWMAALQPEPTPVPQEPQQPEEPYWMAPMPAAEPQKAEELDWMAALQPEPTPVAQEPKQPAAPDWMAALQSEPTPVAQEPQKSPAPSTPVAPDWMTTLGSGKEITPAAQDVRKSPASNDIPAISRISETPQPVRVPDTRPDRVPITPGPVFEPVSPSRPADTGTLSRSLSTPHPEPLLDNELETTMRRPAVRLQHLQQSRPSAQRDTSPRAQAVDRPQGKITEGQLNYKDHLVRGYQYQLSGDYDEAMQAYRIVIKGSPELLSEVVSNVRALLKLAPKYAAGYRVLGDAYMRQGEYLQAMEAYNKALTMAKKAR